MLFRMFSCAAVALLVTAVSAQQSADRDHADRSSPSRQVKINSKVLPPNSVMVRDGKTYVTVHAVTKALNASEISRGNLLEIVTPATTVPDCRSTASGQLQLSDKFRNAAVRIPDDIERLRPLASKHPPAAIANKFDEIDAAISHSGLYAQTEEDRSIYYALSRASNSLAIMYWKLMQHVPPEVAKQNELDSILCSTESKFALLVGHLSGKESCSVLQRYSNKRETTTELTK